MVTNCARIILGEMTGSGDIPPVMTGMSSMPVVGKPIDKKKISSLSKDKKKKTSQIREAAVDTNVIPDDAEEISNDGTGKANDDTGKADDKNGIESQSSLEICEPLLGTDLAVVAPDATPNFAKPLSAMQVVQPQPVIDNKPKMNGAIGAITGQQVSQPSQPGLESVVNRFNSTLGLAESTDALRQGKPMGDPPVNKLEASRRAFAAFSMFVNDNETPTC
jgi:hypothetical protein